MYDNRLLVIEDDCLIANLICHAATALGFATCIAADPHAIKKACTNWHPTVIAFDILIPGMNGIEIIRILRQQPNKARLILISDNDDLSRRMIESLAAVMGFTIDNKISKPFELDQARTTLQRIKQPLR